MKLPNGKNTFIDIRKEFELLLGIGFVISEHGFGGGGGGAELSAWCASGG